MSFPLLAIRMHLSLGYSKYYKYLNNVKILFEKISLFEYTHNWKLNIHEIRNQ